MIIVIHGDNSLRSHLALRGYIDQLKDNNFIIEKKDTSSVLGSEVEEFLNSTSLFVAEERKAIVLQDFFISKNEKKYKDTINKVKSVKSKYIILYDGEDIKKAKDFKKIDADETIECKKPTKTEMVSWLDKFIEHNDRLNNSIISNVVDRCCLDIWLAYNELIKLDTYCIDKGVDIQDIDKLMIGDNTDDNIFKMVDSLFDGKTKEAFERFYACKKYGISGILILSIIERQIRLIELVREQYKKGEKNSLNISKNVGVPVFAVKKFTGYIAKYNTENIKSLYDRLESYDEKIKVGLIDPYLSCELVFFAVASL